VAPLAVDPEAYFAAGSAVVAAGDGLNAAMTVLTTGFGANTGLDLAGEVFGLTYQSTAESLVKLAAAVINACRHNGAQIQLCASNYSHAEAASVLGGGASVLQPPAEPVKVGAPGPPGTLGPGEPPPLLWAVVQSFVDDVWPNGDVAGLHAAAGCWRTFGAAAGGMQGALNASKTLIGTQQMPEGDLIIQAFSQMGATTGKLGEQCGKMAATLDEFANQVAQAQNAIRDLLHQLESLGDLWNDVVSILDGDALDEIKKIARDINAVLHNLGREARAFEQGITLVMQVADGLVVNMEKSMRGQFTHFLGDAVGNQVATVSDKFINGNEGFVKEAIKAVQGPADLNPGWFVVDPKGAAATWKSTLEDQFKPSLLNEILHPREGGEANLQMWKSLLHLDDWGGSRPGMGQGELGFDVAASLIPGVGEAGAGAEAGAAGARAAEGASEAAEGAGAMGRAGELGDFAATSGALSDIGKASAGLTKDLDNLKLDMPKTDPLPGGRPVGAPPFKPFEAPVEPTPRPVESAPPGTPAPHLPAAPGGSPGPGRAEPSVVPHEPTPTPAAAGGPPEPAPVPAAPSGHLPTPNPQFAEPIPARMPAVDGPPLEPTPSAAKSPQLGSNSGSSGNYSHEPLPSGPSDLPGPSEAPPEADPLNQPPHDSASDPHDQRPADTDDLNPEQPGDADQTRQTISGHGGYDPTHGETALPRGTTVTTYAEHGSTITDALGNLIETGGDTTRVYSKTFYPGESIPNYTIYPPDGLNIMGNPLTVLSPTRLSELLTEDMGDVHLAICTSDPSCPTGKIYHVDGIFDEYTNTFDTYKRSGF
jgi:hypothetical protein